MSFFDNISLEDNVHYFGAHDNGDDGYLGLVEGLDASGTRYAVVCRDKYTNDDITEDGDVDATVDLAVIVRPSVQTLATILSESIEDLNSVTVDGSNYYGTTEHFNGYQTVYEKYFVDVHGLSRGKLNVIEHAAGVSAGILRHGSA